MYTCTQVKGYEERLSSLEQDNVAQKEEIGGLRTQLAGLTQWVASCVQQISNFSFSDIKIL